MADSPAARGRPAAGGDRPPGGTGRPRGTRSTAGDARLGRGARARVDPARLAAFEVLKAVRVDKAYANLVLPTVLGELGLSGRDAAFATELASGTIRLRGSYDPILAACVDRPLRKVEAKVLDALRLGAHQLLSMRVPDHAAISTTVDLVRASVGAGAGNFANAVLRQVAGADLETWLTRVAPAAATKPDDHLAVTTSHPTWVVAELRAALGERVAELPDVLHADNLAPRVTLVARPGLADRAELPGEPTAFSPYGAVLAGGAPGEVAAVAEGRAGVQDEGSQLVAIALANAPIDGPDRLWFDLCSGPGGKASLAAALAARRGAVLVAGESQQHRSRLVRRALGGDRPHPGVAGVITADGTRPPLRPGTIDRVLVDAPCTGLGALRRRPEARWARKPDDLLGLVMLQRELVSAALRLVRPGGVVLYATCSPVIAETAEVVAAIEQQHPEAVLEDATALLPGVPDCSGLRPLTAQLWPHRHGTDAMFLALLRRTR